MTQAKPRFTTFDSYLADTDAQGRDGFYELIAGELVEVPPESEPNNAIAHWLFLKLVELGVPFRLVKPHACEIQVPVLQPGDAQNRYPDLVVLREEHLLLTQNRLTITLDMPPPRLVVEVVSPGKSNRERDYRHKFDQYCHIGILEYWIINPQERVVLVWEWVAEIYRQVGVFAGDDRILSPTFPDFNFTAEAILVNP